MKGSIFMSRVSLSVASTLLQDNETPRKALHFGALSWPDGDTQTEQSPVPWTALLLLFLQHESMVNDSLFHIMTDSIQPIKQTIK